MGKKGSEEGREKGKCKGSEGENQGNQVSGIELIDIEGSRRLLH